MDPYQSASTSVESAMSAVKLQNGMNAVKASKGATGSNNTSADLPAAADFAHVWKRTDTLFSLVKPTELHYQPISLRLPIVFYMGHLPCFMWTQFSRLSMLQPGYTDNGKHFAGVNKSLTVDAHYDEFFQRGVDPTVSDGIVRHSHSSPFSQAKKAAADGELQEESKEAVEEDNTGDVPQLADFDWKREVSVDSVRHYQDKMRVRIAEVMQAIDEYVAAGHTLQWADQELLHIAYEHECMHQETLIYMLQQMPAEKMQSEQTALYKQQAAMLEQQLSSSRQNSQPVNTQWIRLSEEVESKDANEDIVVALGKPHQSTFGWDNELPAAHARVNARTEMQSHPVTNGQFLEFVRAGGYQTPRYWQSADVYRWIQTEGMQYPLQWRKVKQQSAAAPQQYTVDFFFARGIPFEQVANHAVMVSRIEAAAYCRWYSEVHGFTVYLPSEAEWVYSMYDSKHRPMHQQHNTATDFKQWFTQAIPADHSSLYWNGSLWEHTRSKFGPHAGYTGGLVSYHNYSNDFFDDTHYIVLGGSWCTDKKLLRRTFRNWYQQDYRYMFATFRMVRDSSKIANGEVQHDGLTQQERNTIASGLSLPVGQKQIGSQYFYDDIGSQIYTEITQLKEYYLFNAELNLLKQAAPGLKSVLVNKLGAAADKAAKLRMIELGCGDGQKVYAWLNQFLDDQQTRDRVVYQPSDISQEAVSCLLQRMSAELGSKTVDAVVDPVVGTFDHVIANLNNDSIGIDHVGRDIRCVMFLGSSIGNFTHYSNNLPFQPQSPAVQLLSAIADQLSHTTNDYFLCAFDLCKSPIRTLINAYDDSLGVTARFNINLLTRFNRELQLNFDTKKFEHYATYNAHTKAMESYLISTCQQTVTNNQDITIQLGAYEAIQTEISAKYTVDDIQQLMQVSGMTVVEKFIDEENQYALVLCQATAVVAHSH